MYLLTKWSFTFLPFSDRSSSFVLSIPHIINSNLHSYTVRVSVITKTSIGSRAAAGVIIDTRYYYPISAAITSTYQYTHCSGFVDGQSVVPAFWHAYLKATSLY